MSRSTVRVAVVQAAAVAFDADATLAKLEGFVARAAADHGAELVVFPEAFIGGYPKGADFGVRVGTRDDVGRAWFRRYSDGAVTIPGPAVDRLGALAAAHGVELVGGVIERDGSTLYCTAVFVGADGSLRGTHRKLVPTAMERVLWGRGDGSTLTVVDTPLAAGRVGAAICWENYMPLLRAALYARGVEIYCAPTVDDRDVWQATMRHIAVEGRCFVVAACPFATRADFPDDFVTTYGDDPETVLIAGGSCIVDPFGDVLAGGVRDREDLLVAELDARRLAEARFDLDVSGHYARDDVFRLLVDTRARSGVEFDDRAVDGSDDGAR